MRKDKAILLNVGPSVLAIQEARETILDILESNCDQDTIRCALSTFKDVCEIKNTTISGCNFFAEEKSKK